MAREILLFLCHFSCEEVVKSLKNSHMVMDINNVVVNKLAKSTKQMETRIFLFIKKLLQI